MINPNTKLSVIKESQGNYTDYSNFAYDFGRDQFDLELQNNDYLYIGFYKHINLIYFDFKKETRLPLTLTAEVYDGTNWIKADYQDDTNGFSRSGFIQINSTSTVSNINNSHLNYIRFKVEGISSGNILTNGINLIFADDNDLRFEVPEIIDELHLAGKESHILTHVAVRQQLIQDLNNKDFKKISNGKKEDLTPWDILDAHQLKQAAIFLALAKIYFNFSDSTDDKYYQKYNDYMLRYRDAFNLASLYLDSNDDGKINEEERLREPFSNLRIKR